MFDLLFYQEIMEYGLVHSFVFEISLYLLWFIIPYTFFQITLLHITSNKKAINKLIPKIIFGVFISSIFLLTAVVSMVEMSRL